jgi:hypothetical protein
LIDWLGFSNFVFVLFFVFFQMFKRQSQPVVCGQPLYTAAVSETAQPGTFVATAAASDFNGVPLTWSIPDTTLTKFSINPTTGVVSVANQLSRSFSGGFLRSALEFRVRATETTNSQNVSHQVHLTKPVPYLEFSNTVVF